MKDQQGFFRTISGYLKKGIMRQIYSSDALAVLSVADSFYVASDYTVKEQGYVTFLVNSKMVRAMLIDSSFLERLLTSTDTATLSQMMFVLTDQTFRKFKRTKKHDFSENLTHKFVDPGLEQWIFATYGKPASPEAADQVSLERSGVLPLFKGLFTKNTNQ